MEKQLEVIRAADERERLLTTQVVIFFFTIHIFHFFSANFGKSGYSWKLCNEFSQTKTWFLIVIKPRYGCVVRKASTEISRVQCFATGAFSWAQHWNGFQSAADGNLQSPKEEVGWL